MSVVTHTHTPTHTHTIHGTHIQVSMRISPFFALGFSSARRRCRRHLFSYIGAHNFFEMSNGKMLYG